MTLPITPAQAQFNALMAGHGFGTPMPGIPGVPHPSPINQALIPGMAPPITLEQVEALIQTKLEKFVPPSPPQAGPDMSKLTAIIGQLEMVFQRALSPEQYAAFQSYVQAGGPGFQDILNAKALDPCVQLLWETIKESKT